MSGLTEQRITEFKQQLLQLQQELTVALELGEEASGTVTLDQSKVGRLSRMDALQQQAMAQATRATHQQQLKQVGVALAAIASADYGYCEECGEDIPVERLEARPESVYCIKCKRKIEEAHQE